MTTRQTMQDDGREIENTARNQTSQQTSHWQRKITGPFSQPQRATMPSHHSVSIHNTQSKTETWSTHSFELPDRPFLEVDSGERHVMIAGLSCEEFLN